jgi:sortase A
VKQRHVRRSGVALCGIGGLLLAFVAFQLWGTSLSEHSAQSRLSTELHKQLGARPPSAGAHPTTTVPASQSTGDDPTLGVATPVNATAQPNTGAPIGFLSIARIGMNNDAIVQGVGTDQLREGPGHYPGTPLPGQAGNVAIAGHRTTYAAPFYNLDQLRVGDPIVIQTVQGTFHYAVTQTSSVSPSDSAVLDDTPTAELTLTTCTPRYSSSQRLIVVADLQSSQPASGAAHASGHSTPKTKSAAAPLNLAGSSSTTSGTVTGAVLWGLATALIALVAYLAWRRWRRPLLRSATAVVGVPGTLVALFVFFGHVSSLLPPSF